ncbi:MAG: glycosyltransferase family 2 protein, partial [archaeon]|nr:glycosyltransferase family 2 protein [archaeon]
LFMDSDLDLPPEQLKIFLSFMDALKTDIVIGSKRHRLTKLYYPATRRILSFFYSLLLKALFDLNVTDTQVGFKLMKSTVPKHVMPKILVKRYAFDVEFLVVAKKMGYSIAEAPVVIMFKGIESTVNPKQIWHIFVDTLSIFYRLHVKHYYDE